MIKCYLATRMRFLRKAAHLTQDDIAKSLNVERQTYCNYENENRTPPLEFIIRLADFYHVSTDYLLKENAPNADSDVLFPLSGTEEAYLRSFRALSSQNQKEVLQFMQFKSSIAPSDD